jgi:hypothetical protein
VDAYHFVHYWSKESLATRGTTQSRLFNLGLFVAFCLVTNNTLHVRLADYAMISTMSGR